ncbi:alpha/beta hydrolase [Burkholderia anthina]|uniref:alpha/beta hydrolase n=1 Tax=Burkholderia anthina TaxID=179879 RepID=UPI0037C06324
MTGRTAVLLIHGLGGTQYDLGSLHKAMRRAGGDTHMITLPGHGTRPEDLVGVRAEAWLDAVTEQYRALEREYDTLHVAGMCMGALVALLLCHRVQHARGRLALLATPVFIDGWSTPWYRSLRHVLYHVPGVAERMRVEEGEPFGIKNATIRAIVKKKFERQDSFHYAWVPLACVRQVDRMRDWALEAAADTRCQTLVLHAREDELTSLRSADFLLGNMPNARGIVLENSYHMICADNDRDDVARHVLEFFGFDPSHAVSPAMARRMAQGDPAGRA